LPLAAASLNLPLARDDDDGSVQPVATLLNMLVVSGRMQDLSPSRPFDQSFQHHHPGSRHSTHELCSLLLFAINCCTARRCKSKLTTLLTGPSGPPPTVLPTRSWNNHPVPKPSTYRHPPPPLSPPSPRLLPHLLPPFVAIHLLARNSGGPNTHILPLHTRQEYVTSTVATG
jgi:hypothetical protein